MGRSSAARDCMRRTAPSSTSRLGLARRGLSLLMASLMALACGSAEQPDVARLTLDGARCAPGAVACGNDCVELSSSAEHCGACDVACAADSLCDRGHCKPAAEGCSAGLLQCSGDCADTRSDREHCGSCD